MSVKTTNRRVACRETEGFVITGCTIKKYFCFENTYVKKNDNKFSINKMSSILNFILRNSTKACNLKNARQLIQQNKIGIAFLSSNVQKKEVDGARKKVPSPRVRNLQ